MPPSCPRPASAVSFADDEEEAISREDEYGVNEAEEEEQPNDEIAHSSSAKKDDDRGTNPTPHHRIVSTMKNLETLPQSQVRPRLSRPIVPYIIRSGIFLPIQKK